MSEELCHCGQPLHYTSPDLEATVRQLVAEEGALMRVTIYEGTSVTGGRTWMVPRHYIALHGIRGQDLASLGFEEIGSRP